jgi:hypothetical protein
VNEIPPIDDFDLRKLRESIQEHGIREPIVVDEFDKPIDGHNRLMIANELGIECPKRTITGLTEPEKYQLAWTLNLSRRHLSLEQKRAAWREHRGEVRHLLEENPTRSDRSIADQLGIDHKTVAADREALESGGEFPTTEYQPGYGGGKREEREPQAENFADHRNEVWFKLEIGYPCPSDEIRMRGEDPYPKESDRLSWYSGQQYLIASAPRNEADASALTAEIAQRVQREVRVRPLKTMARALA